MGMLKKQDRFIIRKVKGIVGSILLGSLFMLPNTAGASTYHYVDQSDLTQTEKSQIIQGKPDESNENYILVYQKDQLPNTGEAMTIMTSLGLLSAGAVLLVFRKKRFAGLFMVVGLTLVPISASHAVNLEHALRASGSEGIVAIKGYHYVGYIDNDMASKLSTEWDLHKSTSTSSVTAFESQTTNSGNQESHEKPEYTAPISGNLVEPEVHEKSEYTAPISSNLVEPEVHTKPEYTSPISGNLVEPEVHAKPEYTAPISSNLVEPEVHEKPEYTAPIGGNLVEPESHEKPEYTAPIGGNLVEPEIHEKPSIEQPKVETPKVDTPKVETPKVETPKVDTPKVETPKVETPKVETPKVETPTVETPTVETPKVEEPKVETPVLETPKVEEPKKPEQPKEPQVPVLPVEPNDEPKPPTTPVNPQPIKEEPTPPSSPITPTEPLKPTEPAFPITPSEPSKPEQPTAPKEPTEPVKPIAPETPKEKAKPILTLTKVTDDALNRSANLNYHLENTDNAEIKSIIAEIKDGDKVIKTIDLSKEKLEDAVEGLRLYKDYKVATRMTYNRGQDDETTTLEEKPLRLDLKKIELKNIASTNLVKVEEDGTETPSDFITETPTDTEKYYLKVTSSDNKITRLSVDKIEEINQSGQVLYKITAKAVDLIQHTDPTKMRNEYTYYMEKPRPKVGNVYYNFKELIEDMQKNPNGEFKLGADLNATNTPTPSKSYVTAKFTGKLSSDGNNHYTIHNIARPLFANAENAHIHDINFGNVNINMPWANKTAPLGEMFKKSTIENIKVTGNVVGNNDVTGMVNKLDESNMRNVAFIGNITSVGNAGWWSGGLVSESWRSNTDNSYIDAYIKGNKAKVGGLVAKLNHGDNPMDVSAWGRLKNSVAKGTIDVKEPLETGGLLHSNWSWGLAENNITMMKVKNGGEILYGSRDAEDDDYFGANWVRNNNAFVNGISEGKQSYSRSSRWKGISEDEAKTRIAKMGITAHEYEITQHLTDKLNRTTVKADTYKDTQDYDASRERAYRNIEKLQPFYNKEWIINQGNKLADGSNLMTKEVLSVTGMKNGQFVTDLSDIDKIMIHYADGTKEEKVVTRKDDSKVQQVREYTIDGLDSIVYTPNMVDKNRDGLIADVKAKLSTFELISPEVRVLMDKRNKPAENSDNHKNNYIRNLFLEESLDEVKGNLDKLVKAIVENEDHQLNGDDAAMKALVKKVEDNKAKIMLGLAYINRYYGFKYNDMSIKDIMMFKPDFYGKTTSVLDRLIQIGSHEHFLRGDRTQDAYRDVIAGATGKGNLNDFLTYNMKLFTADTDMNVWYKKAVSNTNYIVEKQSSNPLFANKKYHLYENLNNGEHGRYILPLLNTKKAHMFLISTYNTLAFSAFEKYGMNTEAQREEFKKQIDLRAQEQINYLDFWSRLAADNVRDRLLKSENMVPSAIWDNHGAPGGWVDRMGHTKNGDYAPIREFYGPTQKWHADNGMGAYAYIFENPQNSEAVYYIWSSMISDFGTSAFTHETTHINDRMAYLGGWRHREGTDVEAFAQGMLQSPAMSSPNGDYGALGLNMAYERQNDGKQWYNYNPNLLDSRAKIDHYMKNYNEALMMLDHLEADAVIANNAGTNDKWFKKMDKEWRSNADRNSLKGEPHQWDKLRDLNEEENKKKLTSINDLVDGNYVTKHGMPGNGRYRAEGFDTAYQTVNMMAGIYGGNTSKSAVGSISFKHNTFRMWGYFGYLDGFVGYASNKYKDAANKENKGLLGDDFIIKKVSGGKFDSLEAWKKEWFKEVKAKGEKGFVAIEIDGKTITNYAGLRELFDKAVAADLKAGNTNQTVSLKEKVYKQLLQKSNGFMDKLFND